MYLDAAVKERVRVQSVSTYRYTIRDTTLAFLEKGTVVVVSKNGAVRPKAVWGNDAAEFKLERWLDEVTGEPKNVTPPHSSRATRDHASALVCVLPCLR